MNFGLPNQALERTGLSRWVWPWGFWFAHISSPVAQLGRLATMRRLTALPFLLIFLATGCYTHYRAPGAVGRVIDAETGTPVRGARVIRPAIPPPVFFERLSAATAVTDKTGAFNLPPDSHTQIRFMYVRNPESLSGLFVVSADGYATNELHGTATSHTFWRAHLGKILLERP